MGGATYSVEATGGASGNAVSFAIDAASAGICSISGNTVSFAGVGTCTINANQSGNATHAAAAQAQQSFAVGQGSQTLSFRTDAPTNASRGGPTYSVGVNGGSSDSPIFLTLDAAASSVCSISDGVVSFIGVGTCTVNANQAGNANYLAAAQIQQSFAVGKSTQTISFTDPADITVFSANQQVNLTATATSALAVAFTSETGTVCTVDGATATVLTAGTCTISANQAGDDDYAAAPQVQQSFAIAQVPQTIIFTSTAPSDAVVDGSAYSVTATGGESGNAVTFAVDNASTAVCSISGSTVSFTGAGTCTINANQTGTVNYSAAAQVQQSFSVGKAAQAITFTSTPPASAAVGGPTYLVSATGGNSGNTVTFAIAGASAANCSISGSTVSFIGAGECTINADQAGNDNYLAAPQTPQAFTVGKGSQTISFTDPADIVAFTPNEQVSLDRDRHFCAGGHVLQRHAVGLHRLGNDSHRHRGRHLHHRRRPGRQRQLSGGGTGEPVLRHRQGQPDGILHRSCRHRGVHAERTGQPDRFRDFHACGRVLLHNHVGLHSRWLYRHRDFRRHLHHRCGSGRR